MGEIRYISDLHLDGRGPFRVEHPEYACLEDWHRDLVADWNREVQAEDAVWILGDVCLTMREDVIAVLEQLNGDLNLIRGNHDKVEKYPFYKERFSQILDMADVLDSSRHVVLCHYPLESWNRKIWGSIHLHGHIHGNIWDAPSQLPNRYNAWSTALGCIPRTLDWFIDRYGYTQRYYEELANKCKALDPEALALEQERLTKGQSSLFEVS